MNETNLNDFKPTLRNTSGNTWEASIQIPVIGWVSVSGNGWQEARIRLWIVVESVRHLSEMKSDPSKWSDDEWKATLKAMFSVMGNPITGQ